MRKQIFSFIHHLWLSKCMHCFSFVCKCLSYTLHFICKSRTGTFCTRFICKKFLKVLHVCDKGFGYISSKFLNFDFQIHGIQLCFPSHGNCCKRITYYAPTNRTSMAKNKSVQVNGVKRQSIFPMVKKVFIALTCLKKCCVVIAKTSKPQLVLLSSSRILLNCRDCSSHFSFSFWMNCFSASRLSPGLGEHTFLGVVDLCLGCPTKERRSLRSAALYIKTWSWCVSKAFDNQPYNIKRSCSAHTGVRWFPKNKGFLS